MSKTILIIEDRLELCENIADILKLRHYLVLTARDGKEGVNLALSNAPDLIICDIIMPELDGYGVLQILNQHQATCRIPFIFLTAKTELRDYKKGMDLGADEYLVKPFEGTDLLNLVEVSIKKSVNWRNRTKAKSHSSRESLMPNQVSVGFEKLPDKELLTNFRTGQFSRKAG